MKLDEWAVQDAVESGDFSRMVPVLVEHYGVGRIPDWHLLENEHLDCTICALLRVWLQEQIKSA